MHSITHYRSLTFLLATFVTVVSFVLPPPKLKSTNTITLDQQILGHGHGISPVLYDMYNEDEDNNSNNAGGNNQKLILFKRGNAMSGAPNINGTNQFPNPPIIVGITKKKIITKACPVTITL